MKTIDIAHHIKQYDDPHNEADYWTIYQTILDQSVAFHYHEVKLIYTAKQNPEEFVQWAEIEYLDDIHFVAMLLFSILNVDHFELQSLTIQLRPKFPPHN